ncbi:MAG TPA: SpoIIIAH-like family protein [Firmicutes bacterium]|nr:SpoIIIAH-like family protein [Bacillota bacterium]
MIWINIRKRNIMTVVGIGVVAVLTLLVLPSLRSLPVTRVGEQGVFKPSGEGNFFADARMNREKTVSRQIEELKKLAADQSQDKAVRSQATSEFMALTERYRKQVELETQLRGRGYEETLVFLNPGRVEVLVGRKTLTKEDVARIGELISKNAGVPLTSITISSIQE